MATQGDEDAGPQAPTYTGPQVQDPFQIADPWANATRPSQELPPTIGAPAPSGFGLGGMSSNMAVALPNATEPPPQRFVHDVPPAWDGKDPDN